MSDTLKAAAAAATGTDIGNVSVVKTNASPYEGRGYEVRNLMTGSVVYVDLDADDAPAPATEPATADTDDDLASSTVAELKGIANRLGVSVGGSKAQLIARINAALDQEDE